MVINTLQKDLLKFTQKMKELFCKSVKKPEKALVVEIHKRTEKKT